jgi:hypothetical protein
MKDTAQHVGLTKHLNSSKTGKKRKQDRSSVGYERCSQSTKVCCLISTEAITAFYNVKALGSSAASDCPVKHRINTKLQGYSKARRTLQLKQHELFRDQELVKVSRQNCGMTAATKSLSEGPPIFSPLARAAMSK